jgi:hypothetical protein
MPRSLTDYREVGSVGVVDRINCDAIIYATGQPVGSAEILESIDASRLVPAGAQ